MGAGRIKREREEEPVSLALSLSTDSTSTTTSADSAGAAPMAARKRARRGRVVATSGEGDFVCKTCGRAFTSFQALGGHRTSHLRGRHGLELGVGVAKAIRDRKRIEEKDRQHECHICGLGFEMGQALGGHMRRHREEMAALSGTETSRSSMAAGIKREREEQPVSLALSLTTDSTTSSTTSADSAGAMPMAARKRARRGGRVVATSGEGDFVCKTCGRAFTSFQALGGHRTSHLRGRHGLELGVGVAKAIRDRKRLEDKDRQHECHVCGLGFEMGQALGGHMRRHREEMALSGGEGQWVIALPDQKVVLHGADRPPILLPLFV